MTKTYITLKGDFYFSYRSKGKVINDSFKCRGNSSIGYLTTANKSLIEYIESRPDFGVEIKLESEEDESISDKREKTKAIQNLENG